MMKAAEAPRTPLRGAQVWPLTIAAYRALGEAALSPRTPNCCMGSFTRNVKAPVPQLSGDALGAVAHSVLSAGFLLRTEQPVTCGDFPNRNLTWRWFGGAKMTSETSTTNGRAGDRSRVTSHEFDRSKLPAYAAAG